MHFFLWASPRLSPIDKECTQHIHPLPVMYNAMRVPALNWLGPKMRAIRLKIKMSRSSTFEHGCVFGN